MDAYIELDMTKVKMLAMLLGKTIHKFASKNKISKAEICQAFVLLIAATLDKEIE